MTDNRSLHDLILLMKNGDDSAHEALYEKVRPKLFNHITRKYAPTLTEDDAQDVIHNTFIKVNLYAHQYKGPNAEGWIYQIARSEASKIIKVRKRYAFSLDDDDNNSSAVSERNSHLSDLDWEGEDSVEERAFNLSVLNALEKNADKLSTEDWNLLRLRYEEECTYDDIGRHLNRTKVRAKQKHDGIIAKIRSLLRLDEI